MRLIQFLFVLAISLVGNVQSLHEQEDAERQEHEGKLTELFAIELDQHDEKLARDIAKKYGFEYGGEIYGLPRHFKFVKKSIHTEGDEKRGDIPRPSLIDHPNVKWHEQQRELILEKRTRYDIFTNNQYDQDYMSTRKKLKDSNINYDNDPMFPKQWYINSEGQVPGVDPGHDMGILKAWKMGYTGKGIVATVMDDGLDHTNIDLKQNYDPEASYDVNDHDHDPQPRDKEDQYHGTKCSGEIAAAANNSFCGVGLAPDIKIGGIRMLDGTVTGITESSAFSFNRDHIDIYSASWGPRDNGQIIAGPSNLGKKALEAGVEHGRKGKGSIFVWASGNGGAFEDNCGCDGYASSIYTIAIGSVGSHGKTTYYDEICAATMAVVYSGDDSTGSQPLVTTARGEHGCIPHFGGTSAAAPLAVGIFALVLQANRDLTWRDLQHLVTKTSRTDLIDLKDHSWITNAAGYKVSSKFGFGLLSAPALIEEAKKWKTVPPQRNCTSQGSIQKKEPLKRDGKIIVTLTSDACKGTENHITKLEHVQVVTTLRHRHRGVLSISVDSPSHTKSQLLSIRPHDNSRKGVTNWPFMSVHFWGENPEGIWTLTIKDNTKITDKRYNLNRVFDESEIQERSETAGDQESEEDLFKFSESDEPAKMPFRHEIVLQDEIEADESEDQGRRDYTRQEDESYNIFDVRSDVYGELDSWSLVQYGTNE